MPAAMMEVIICVVFLHVTSVFASTNSTNQTYTMHSTTTIEPHDFTTVEDFFKDKHETFHNCKKFELDPDEYAVFPNGTAYVEVYNKTYTESFYILMDGILVICAPKEVIDNMNPPSSLASISLNRMTTIGIGISMVCLLIHLVVFALVPDLQNLPGCNLASLCASLFLSYLPMIVARTEEVSENNISCIAAAVSMQFFFLASFMWMFIMAFDVFRSILHATGSLRVSDRGFKAKKYIYNSLVAWGTALIFTAAALIVDNVDGVSEPYRPRFDEFCWFKQKQSLLTFFAGPVFTLICLNFILFGISAYNIFTNRMKSTQDSQRSNLQKSHLLYFRLAVIMGVTWITGALAPWVHALWLWYLFAILNTFQGFFIFVAFTCSNKVKNYFKKKLFGIRRPSEINLTPTFQSYCYYANSIEKDLDKVVDSKDKSIVTDTIVIHL